MSVHLRFVSRALGIVFLIGLAFFCGYGFLASFELGFPNGFHVLYGAVGVAAAAGATWLAVAPSKQQSVLLADQFLSFPSVAFFVFVLVGVVGGICGGAFGLVIGSLVCGNYAPDFVFADVRGYEAGASLGAVLGFVIGGIGSGVVAAIALHRDRHA